MNASDPVALAHIRQEESPEWVRVEDAQREHKITDGQVLTAWGEQRIELAVWVPPAEFWSSPHDRPPVYVHLGGPLRVPQEVIAQFSAVDLAEIAAVWSPPLFDGDNIMLDFGRNLVLAKPIQCRLGALWIDRRQVLRILERPAERVLTEALTESLGAQNDRTPPKGQKLRAQIDALIRVIESLGYHPLHIPDWTKGEILSACSSSHPELFPPKTGAIHAWRTASKEGRIRHSQNRN
ncbi:hypothetical protein [Acidithiobacillus sp.]|uniref:hypothetical protein n=1 Tax=Acidithiobacillus sp. TaxID=1872118 RepID=UPI003D006AA0